MLVDVKNLSVTFKNNKEEINIIKNISFNLQRGEILAIVGESGSGKTVTGFSIMRLFNEENVSTEGEVNLDSCNLLELTEKEMQKIRGNKISMIYQDPMTALNPLLKIGTQISEVLVIHKGYTRKDAIAKTKELLDIVKIINPKEAINKYPHQLSGGQRQRVVIAMALACSPELIIADEPTTALDVTIQREILELLLEIKKSLGTSIIFITHDLGVVAEVANRVMVLYGGKILEVAEVNDFFKEPKHPYSNGLINSRPIFAKDNRLYSINGMPINPKENITGCNFYNRCEKSLKCCNKEVTPMIKVSDTHNVRCLLYK